MTASAYGLPDWLVEHRRRVAEATPEGCRATRIYLRQAPTKRNLSGKIMRSNLAVGRWIEIDGMLYELNTMDGFCPPHVLENIRRQKEAQRR